MSAPTTLQGTATADRTAEMLISADSHVMEPHDLWTNALASQFGDAAPALPAAEGG